MATGSYPPERTGGGLQCQALIRTLGSAFDCRVLTTTTHGLPLFGTVDGVAVRRVRLDATRPASAAGLLRLTTAFLDAARGARLLHLHGASKKAVPLVLLAKARGMRVVLKHSSLGFDDAVSLSLRGAPTRLACRRVDAFVGPAPAFAERHRAAGLPDERFHAIPNGVDLDRFRPAAPAGRAARRAALGLPADTPLVLAAGFVSRLKGSDVLAEAWRRLPGAPTLLFLGARDARHGEVEPALADRLAAEGGDRLRFADTDAPERYYAAADAFVLASQREGQPNALLEAMACGLPCIASRLPGITDALIEDGRSGRLFPPGDVEAVARAIAEPLDHPALAAGWGAAARDAVARTHDIRQVALQYAALYRAVCS